MNKVAFFFIWALIVSIPMEGVFVFQGFGTFSRLIGVIATIVCFFAITLGEGFRNIKLFHILFGLFILWNMATFYWTVDPETSKKTIITLTQLFIFVLLIWQFAQSENEQNKLFNAYVVGAILSSIGVIYNFMQEIQAGYFRYTTFGYNANDLGLVLVLAVPMAWHLSFLTNKKAMVLIYRAYIPVSLFAICLTASRASFVAFLISIIYIYWTSDRLSFKLKVAFGILFIASIFISMEFLPSYSVTRLSTIVDEIAYGDLNSRRTIWSDGIKVFSDNPILGVGSGSFSASIANYLGHEKASHNLFMSILIEGGIVGFSIFVSIIVSLIMPILKMDFTKRKLSIILLTTLFFGVMTLSWAYRKPTWFLFGLLAAYSGGSLTSESEPAIDL